MRKHKIAPPVAVMEFAPIERALDKQSPYSDKPWQPGQIPRGTGSLMPITGPLDASRGAYGEFMAVDKPVSRGRGKPREGQP